MFWLVFWILVCVAILAYGIRRRTSLSIRIIMTKRIFLNNIKQNLRLLSRFQEPFVVILRTKNAPALNGSVSYFIAFMNL